MQFYVCGYFTILKIFVLKIQTLHANPSHVSQIRKRRRLLGVQSNQIFNVN